MKQGKLGNVRFHSKFMSKKQGNMAHHAISNDCPKITQLPHLTMENQLHFHRDLTQGLRPSSSILHHTGKVSEVGFSGLKASLVKIQKLIGGFKFCSSNPSEIVNRHSLYFKIIPFLRLKITTIFEITSSSLVTHPFPHFRWLEPHVA
jgi:hypothetical protein